MEETKYLPNTAKKRVTVVVTNCWACPHGTCNDWDELECQKTGRDVCSSTRIPIWCPMEDES
jgi:exosome complex RNA-binding protein Csl4